MALSRKKHVIIITALIVLLTALSYLGDVPLLGSSVITSAFIKGQLFQEICLVAFAPVLIYTAVVFRIRGTIIATLTFTSALIPHALLYSPYPDPIFREASFSIISLLLGGLIANQLNNREVIEKEQEELKHYTVQTLKTEESERLHLSHELHDETIQELVDISHDIDNLKESLDIPEIEIRAQLDQLRADVDSVMEGTRRFIQGLRPPLLEELGLLPSLRWLAEQTEQEMDIRIIITASEFPGRLPGDVELNLFRISQEIFTNVKRHSQATIVDLSLEYTKGWVTLHVQDNGIGFSQPNIAQLEKDGKYGLLGITERTRLIGGRVGIKTSPDKGTTLKVELPIGE